MARTDSAKQIKIITGIEAVRNRPGMYIGSTGPRGLHHLVYEVVDNCINEAIAGYCTQIEIELNADGSVSVTDDGRGIPVDTQSTTGKSFLETALTTVCAWKPSNGSYKVSGGLHGVGLAIVNALSEWLEVTVWREGKIYTQRCDRGTLASELIAKPSQENRTGTSVCFKPDPDIFTTGTEFDYNTIAQRLRELAYLNSGLKITFADKRLELLKISHPKVEIYHDRGGIREYIFYLNRDKQPLHDEVIYIKGERDGVDVEVALQWCAADIDNTSYGDSIWSFVNSVRAIDGGTHLEGLKRAITIAFKAIARQRYAMDKNESKLNGEYLREGLSGIVSVKVANPEFGGATKTKLANPEVGGIVDSIVRKALSDYIKLHPQIAEAIVEQAIQASNAAVVARQARCQRLGVSEAMPKAIAPTRKLLRQKAVTKN